MSDNTKVVVDPITDETIAFVVQFVESAEVMAREMNCSIAKAVEYQFRMIQTFQRLQRKDGLSSLSSLSTMPVKAARPQ